MVLKFKCHECGNYKIVRKDEKSLSHRDTCPYCYSYWWNLYDVLTGKLII